MAPLLYLDCSSGISGDMTVAALLDLGADEKAVRNVLSSLDVAGFDVCISRVEKSGLDVCDFAVVLDGDYENHDHDMAYLYGGGDSAHDESDHRHDPDRQHDHGHDPDPDPDPDHDHRHDHGHDPDPDHRHDPDPDPDPDHDPDHRHDQGGHCGEHRNLADILQIIDHARMSEHAKDIARRVFEILAEAEASVHGKPVDEVHFHEVGAVDSIADIIAVAVCLDDLGVTDVVVRDLSEGRGTIRCQHGIIPIPVPAVAQIVSAYSIPLHFLNVEGELVTPTGAAIVAAIRTSDTLPKRFNIVGIGMGAGKREYKTSGILRAMFIEPATSCSAST